MALVHQFAIIPENSTQVFVTRDMDFVEIPDNLMLYIADTLAWVYSNWNGKEKKSGISYYGFSVIESDDIKKLIDIIKWWKKIFELAPNQFFLTGKFLLEQGQYEKNSCNKDEIIEILSSWICLCKKALEKKAKILHNGI